MFNKYPAEMSDDVVERFCSDGFLLNLCHVMLQLCQPFFEPKHEQLLSVKPTYYHATETYIDCKVANATGWSIVFMLSL